MNNADMPAMPLTAPDRSIVSISEEDHALVKQCNGAIGLTKREEFAKAAMQGFCAAPDAGDWAIDDLAEIAVRQADALLAELERTGGRS